MYRELTLGATQPLLDIEQKGHRHGPRAWMDAHGRMDESVPRFEHIFADHEARSMPHFQGSDQRNYVPAGRLENGGPVVYRWDRDSQTHGLLHTPWPPTTERPSTPRFLYGGKTYASRGELPERNAAHAWDGQRFHNHMPPPVEPPHPAGPHPEHHHHSWSPRGSQHHYSSPPHTVAKSAGVHQQYV